MGNIRFVPAKSSSSTEKRGDDPNNPEHPGRLPGTILNDWRAISAARHIQTDQFDSIRRVYTEESQVFKTTLATLVLVCCAAGLTTSATALAPCDGVKQCKIAQCQVAKAAKVAQVTSDKQAQCAAAKAARAANVAQVKSGSDCPHAAKAAQVAQVTSDKQAQCAAAKAAQVAQIKSGNASAGCSAAKAAQVAQVKSDKKSHCCTAASTAAQVAQVKSDKNPQCSATAKAAQVAQVKSQECAAKCAAAKAAQVAQIKSDKNPQCSATANAALVAQVKSQECAAKCAAAAKAAQVAQVKSATANATYVAFGCTKTDAAVRKAAYAYLKAVAQMQEEIGAKGCALEAASKTLAAVVSEEMAKYQGQAVTAKSNAPAVTSVSLGSVSGCGPDCTKACCTN